MKLNQAMRYMSKYLQYAKVYGLRRSVLKSAGRLNSVMLGRLSLGPFLFWTLLRPRRKNLNIGVIGCGQFGFATIGWFLNEIGIRAAWCYDTEIGRTIRFARTYGSVAAQSLDEVDIAVSDAIFVASDHKSHSTYAIKALENHVDVHIEKPIATTWEQLRGLNTRVNTQRDIRVAAGYNRPFSKAIEIVRKRVVQYPDPPILSNMTVHGHNLHAEHWYRDPSQGTRIAGNLGHWIDLTLYLWLSRNWTPRTVHCWLSVSDETVWDDNFVLTMKNDSGDLSTISLFSKTEPFEGINEQLSIQAGKAIFHIDDFRRMSTQTERASNVLRFRPKDVGHEKCLRQIVDGQVRQWNHVVLSSAIILAIRDMVQSQSRYEELNLSKIWVERIGGPFPFAK